MFLQTLINNTIEYFVKHYKGHNSRLNIRNWDNMKYFEDNKHTELYNLKTKNKKQLQKLCKLYNKKVSGTKSELIKRLDKGKQYHIEKALFSFIRKMSHNQQEYEDTLKFWKSLNYFNSNSNERQSDEKNTELLYQNLITYKRTLLVELCKKYKKPHTGTKDILIDRLCNKTVPAKKKKPKKKQPSYQIFNSHIILKKIRSENKKVIQIKQIHTEPNYYVYKPYRLILNENKIVIGKLNQDSHIKKKNFLSKFNLSFLKKEDISICQSLGFEFIWPMNLDV